MLLVILFIGFVTYYIGKFYSKVKQLPPGPFPLPFIGNIPQLAWGMYWYGGVIPLMKSWQKKYGDLLTFYLGPIATVNICDYETAVETMIKQGITYVDRTKIPVMDIPRNGKGVIFSTGQHWMEQRRFTLHTLRNFGLGKNVMQERIMREFDHRSEKLNDEIKKSGGLLNFDPFHFLEMTVGNIINRILLTEGFLDEKERYFFSLKEAMDKGIDNPSLLDFFLYDNTKNWPILNNRFREICDPVDNVIIFIKEQVNERKLEIASGRHLLRDSGDDFVDAFLIEMQKKDALDSFDEDTLAVTVLDLWTAGQETTMTTLYWAFTYLLLNPEIAAKLQKELDEVIGNEGALEQSDKSRTPYLNAVITETLRVSSIFPFNLLRDSTEDTVIRGFRIPKGTAITAQLSLIISNEKLFPEPEKFKPERFLDSNLEQYVIPFGLGRRSCLGESLARAELYLILGNFLLNYNFSPDSDHPAKMSAVQEVGGMRKAHRFHMNISKRL